MWKWNKKFFGNYSVISFHALISIILKPPTVLAWTFTVLAMVLHSPSWIVATPFFYLLPVGWFSLVSCFSLRSCVYEKCQTNQRKFNYSYYSFSVSYCANFSKLSGSPSMPSMGCKYVLRLCGLRACIWRTFHPCL